MVICDVLMSILKTRIMTIRVRNAKIMTDSGHFVCHWRHLARLVKPSMVLWLPNGMYVAVVSQMNYNFIQRGTFSMVNIRYNLLAQSPSQTVKLQVPIQLLLPLPGLLQAHLDPLLPLFCQSSCKRRWMNAKKQDVGDFQGCAGGISGSTHMRSSTCS